MYTVNIKNAGEILIEKPHNSIFIRHIDGDVQIKKSVQFSKAPVETIVLANGKFIEFDELDSGTVFSFEGAGKFEVLCELN
ncbi:MAG: hypothetical protein ACLQQ4_02530 [Bacteroidia bacterium]